jgi:signal-transduction protein with cAMP-binding, CBS, and nucleotidyltransferase domain
MKTGIKVMDAMTKTPVIVGPEETIINCANKMIEGEVGSLIIEKDGKILGILTEKDLMTRVVAKNLNVEQTSVKEVMSTKILHVEPELDLYDAMFFMSRENVRRLPVVKEEKLMGLLTYSDVLKIQPDLYDLFVEKFKLKEE